MYNFGVHLVSKHSTLICTSVEQILFEKFKGGHIDLYVHVIITF